MLHVFEQPLTKNVFAIADDNVNKVQNALIFGRKWQDQLSVEAKIEIDLCSDTIGFDPTKMVTFMTMIETDLEKLTNQKTFQGVKTYIEREHIDLSNETYTIRNGIADSAYYIQRGQFLDESDKSMLRLHKPYIEFIYRHIKK